MAGSGEGGVLRSLSLSWSTRRKWKTSLSKRYVRAPLEPAPVTSKSTSASSPPVAPRVTSLVFQEMSPSSVCERAVSFMKLEFTALASTMSANTTRYLLLKCEPKSFRAAKAEERERGKNHAHMSFLFFRRASEKDGAVSRENCAQ